MSYISVLIFSILEKLACTYLSVIIEIEKFLKRLLYTALAAKWRNKRDRLTARAHFSFKMKIL